MRAEQPKSLPFPEGLDETKEERMGRDTALNTEEDAAVRKWFEKTVA